MFQFPFTAIVGMEDAKKSLLYHSIDPRIGGTLLPDHLADCILDSAASGQYRMERDGIRRSVESRHILVGTMNPDEGDLRPQLSDRFSHGILIRDDFSEQQRIEIVKRRIAFDDDPEKEASGKSLIVEALTRLHRGKLRKGSSPKDRALILSDGLASPEPGETSTRTLARLQQILHRLVRTGTPGAWLHPAAKHGMRRWVPELLRGLPFARFEV